MPDTLISPRTTSTAGPLAEPPRRTPFAGKDRYKNVCCTLTEARLVRAYLMLFLVSWEEGARAVPLARFGAYEVRLVEFAQDDSAGFALWLELYRHDAGASLDSCGCGDFDEAVRVIDALIARARELHRSAERV